MKKIVLKYFKAFKDVLEINLSNKSLLLYGENGAGKSSLYEALKIIFFKQEIQNSIPSVSTPEEQRQVDNDFWNKYNNKVINKNFEILVNDIDYQNFSIDQYQVFMISLTELGFNNTIRLDSLLQTFPFNITDIDQFCSNNYREVESLVNSSLEQFTENVRIEIDIEDDFTIKIIDPKKNIASKTEIKKYFNEAKLNLIILLVLFTSIIIGKDNVKKKILILDDFITSLDTSNRTFLIKYVFDNFYDFQKLIFTHNVSFYNLSMYFINEIFKKESEWEFANLYEINNDSKLYLKSARDAAKTIENDYNTIGMSISPAQIEHIGNRIRQRFEVLLYEFSKLLMIGAVEDNKKILERIEKSKNIYYLLENNEIKTAYELIDEILERLNQTNETGLRNRLLTLINKYTYPNLYNMKNIIRELKLYQKVTMHPMSHGSIGQSSFTTIEIKKSIELLIKFEKQLKDLFGGNVERI